MMKKLTLLLVITLSLALSGCILKPYVPEVQQGNVLHGKIKQLEYGMSKEHVRYLLGSPILVNVFDDDYWTYVYTDQINGGKLVEQFIALSFKNDKLVKIDKQYHRFKLPPRYRSAP